MSIQVIYHVPPIPEDSEEYKEAEGLVRQLTMFGANNQQASSIICWLASELKFKREEVAQSIMEDTDALIAAVERATAAEDREKTVALYRSVNDLAERLYAILKEDVDCPYCGGSGGHPDLGCHGCFGRGTVPAPDDI